MYSAPLKQSLTKNNTKYTRLVAIDNSASYTDEQIYQNGY